MPEADLGIRVSKLGQKLSLISPKPYQYCPFIISRQPRVIRLKILGDLVPGKVGEGEEQR